MNTAIRLLISSTPSMSCLQHPRILVHWAVQYCFTELIDDSPTAPFLAFESTFFKASHTGTKGSACRFGDSPSWTRQSTDFHFLFFSAYFCSVLHLSVHASKNSSSAVQIWCLNQCYTRLNHECTQQDLIYLCKDYLCTK
ncbi:hypothetical protein H5410_045698 [Solanum commersonii]|uniref:Uncharacterized protein n=1 Tax=Solanum commersonii TaxID=4109 RepID=A0A9J5XEF0_SOLCO|nr:hypothetical protein H5410_045698 [Solanum commersonii]